MAHVQLPSPAGLPTDGALSLKPLAALVVKEGLSLGGLKEGERTLVLALAATVFEPGQPLTEPQVNLQLKQFLAEPGTFLDVDHVELRRWLVDAGWLQRDGFGRQYQRAPIEALQPHHQLAGQQLAGQQAQAAASTGQP
jgi:hypothetical protein